MNFLIIDLTILAFSALIALFTVTRSRSTGRVALGIFAFVFMGMITLAAEGCGGAQRTWDQNAHIGVNTSTHALRVADTTITELYLREARQMHTIESLDAVNARFRPALEAERIALASLQAAEHAIDTAVLTGRSEDKCIVRTLLERARLHTADAIRIVRAFNVTISPETESSVETIATVIASLGPSCPSSSSSPPPGGTP